MTRIFYISTLLFIAIACQRQLHFPPEQDLSMLKADKTSLLLPDRIPATDSFLIESNVEWAISVTPSTANWFTLDKMSGSGSVKVYASINTFNLTDTAWKATITITAVNKPSLTPVIISIAQNKRILPGENAFGGTTFDEFAAVINTPDGGYIAVGRSDSKNGDVDGVHGAPEDVWVVKFNAEHRIMWQRAWGGTRRDFASNIIAAH